MIRQEDDALAVADLDALRDEVLALAAREPSLGSVNVGGWKSDVDFLARRTPAVRALRVAILDRGIRWRPGNALAPLVGWAMVNRAGSEHPRHVHGKRYACGVLYVTAGDPAVPTVFDVVGGERIAVEPKPGRLILFNGDVPHHVPRYDGQAPRITVAFEFRHG